MNAATELDRNWTPEETIVRVGDAMLYAWGEAKRNGELERVLEASIAAISDGGTARAPGTHSDPTLARILACDPKVTEAGAKDGHMAAALTVEREMAHWRRERHTKLWAKVAELYYAGARGTTSGQVARELTRQGIKIGERTVKSIRGQMRRYLVVAARRAVAILPA